MKIISEADNGFLVKMSKEELEIILGMPKDEPSEYRYGSSKNQVALEIANKKGEELNISQYYHKLQNFNRVSLENHSYNSARKQLNKMLELLTPVEQLIDTMANKINEENIIK